MEDNLFKNDSLDFYFIMVKRVEKELEKGYYYMVIIFFKDFFRKVIIFMIEKLERLNIIYKIIKGCSFVVLKMSEIVVNKLKDEIVEFIIGIYIELVFKNMGFMKIGINKVVDGS